MATDDRPFSRSFDTADDKRDKGGVQIEVVQLGELTAKRATYPPGWRFSKDMGAERCQDTHVGYMVSGRIHVQLTDGTEFEIKGGDAVMVPAGHDAWVVGDQPAQLVQFDEGESAAKRFGVK